MSEPLNGQETAELVTTGPCTPPTRDPNTGRFGPGNAGGGRRKMPDDVREMLEAKSTNAAQRLIDALDATKVVHYMGVEVGHYVDHEMRTRAALALFERLYGKTPQAIVTQDEEGNPSGVVGIVFLPTGAKP